MLRFYVTVSFSGHLFYLRVRRKAEIIDQVPLTRIFIFYKKIKKKIRENNTVSKSIIKPIRIKFSNLKMRAFCM